MQEREFQMGKNVEDKRLQILRSRSEDAYKGVLWLRSNKDKFSATVHEPMCMKINVKDGRYAKYFESQIAMRDLTAFVCEDKNDMNIAQEVSNRPITCVNPNLRLYRSARGYRCIMPIDGRSCLRPQFLFSLQYGVPAFWEEFRFLCG